jgi:hypothetical protein
MVGLGLDANQANFFLEPILPVARSARFVVKNKPISRGPNDPAGSNCDFSEDMTPKVGSQLNDHAQGRKAQIPCDANGVPIGLTEWTLKEEMHNGFFRIGVTNSTTVTSQMHVLSS